MYIVQLTNSSRSLSPLRFYFPQLYLVPRSRSLAPSRSLPLFLSFSRSLSVTLLSLFYPLSLHLFLSVSPLFSLFLCLPRSLVQFLSSLRQNFCSASLRPSCPGVITTPGPRTASPTRIDNGLAALEMNSNRPEFKSPQV